MTAHELEAPRPPCEQNPRLFMSPLLADHKIARESCKTCPAALFAACRDLGRTEKNHDGTYAAVLYIDGKPSKKGKRFCKDEVA